ncbi:hypothetical protein PENARI_c016G09431 [Penicillium arizonense]|uniref:Protein kinase domain-containing protein n=1 Tax=Penicillium arizonense TaxID=1835702 RepID=A0A1F5LBR6_PENAI|nr:hypothetical protein PENARI_c016G09431 [Penicillium arizonense]OGE50654.1 hypothetical protein PENARI_c016G09431 [Penicillium arizonense]
MSQHAETSTSLWWPEERIKSTLDTKCIVSRLRQENIPRLFELPRWGEGLTSETYMEYILLKAGRLFLILDAIGIPDRIFALVDESCDDDDLPIAEHSVDLLRLCPHGEDINLDTRFFHAQWRFLVRGIGEGDHVVYTENEGVPVEVVRSHTSSGLHGRDDTVDKVVLAGSVCRVYMRTQVQVGGAPHFFSSNEVLAEIRKLRKLSHEHLISVYASYLKDDSVSVLFTNATADWTLHGFLTDEPSAFKRLPKEQRRQTLITWPHCLASAVSWLHSRGHSHGAIRPSNIYIDANYHISLGQFQALDSLLNPPHVNDLEAYNYSAPERWVRPSAPAAPQKPPPPTQTLLQSGGRTKRRTKPARLALSPLNESPPSSTENPRPDSAASKGTVIRIGLPGSPSRFSFAFSSSSSSAGSSSASSAATDATASPNTNPSTTKKHRPSFWPLKSRARTFISSSSTSSSSASSTTISIPPSSPSTTSFSISPTNTLHPPSSSLRHSKSAQSLASSFRPPTPHSTAPSSTSNSLPQDSPADLFSLAAVTLDILTTLHKRTLTSFSTHRSARNRSAGRGGGMADASFHLSRNAVQIQSWIASLEGDALKRCRRDRKSDRCFWAVPRILIVVRAMLDGDVGRRPSAKRVRRCFGGAVKIGFGDVHCGKKGEKGDGGKKEKENDGDGGGGYGRNLESIGEEGGSGSGFGSSASVAPASIAPSIFPSESASEFDFGFEDTASCTESEDETEHEREKGPRVKIQVEEDSDGDLSEDKPEIRVDRVSPQLYLPDLDVNITGFEGLTFNR